MENPKLRMLIRNFAIEMLVYAVLVVAYFFLVLRLLAEPLETLFSSSLPLYAFVALLLIVAQAVLLEAVTSQFVRWLGLELIE